MEAAAGQPLHDLDGAIKMPLNHRHKRVGPGPRGARVHEILVAPCAKENFQLDEAAGRHGTDKDQWRKDGFDLGKAYAGERALVGDEARPYRHALAMTSGRSRSSPSISRSCRIDSCRACKASTSSKARWTVALSPRV